MKCVEDRACQPVALVMFTAQGSQFTLTFFCFGWMPLQGEKSERVLELTADMINSNSADYTAWQYRWDTLLALKSDLQRECTFTE
jgi:protein farnesyltransferase/geranylgeranyltransferase type-1 subunit alpha